MVGIGERKTDAEKTDKERERDRQRKIVILRPIALEDIDFIHDDIMEPYSLEPRGKGGGDNGAACGNRTRVISLEG